MEIKRLKIFSNKLKQQEHFFKNVLGFSTFKLNENKIVIEAGSTQLILEASTTKSFYHIAFLIPTGTLKKAIFFLESKDINLLRHEGNKIVYFDEGTAIYFFDEDGNILEFIERPALGYTSESDFSVNTILKVNEIGLTVTDPFLMKDQLINNFGVNPGQNAPMRSDFCWLGDHNGAIIVSKEGRPWLPTQIKGTFNDFRINYTENEVVYDLSFVKDIIKNNKRV